jgi:hypothetical protein
MAQPTQAHHLDEYLPGSRMRKSVTERRLKAPAAIFRFTTPNIGDDVQAFAILSHLSGVNAFVDRDRLDTYQAEIPHVCVFNSWFQIPTKRPFRLGHRLAGRAEFRYPVPSRSVRPIFFGFCLGRPELLSSEWRDYLAEHAPIGCRDIATTERLRAAGIDAFWTGCLTMFAGRRFAPIPNEEREDIVFVDVDAQTEQRFIPKEIGQEAVRLTAITPPSLRHDPLLRLSASAS